MYAVFHDFRGNALVCIHIASLHAAFEAYRKGLLDSRNPLDIPAGVHFITPKHSNVLWDECPQGFWVEDSYPAVLRPAAVYLAPSSPSCMVLEIVSPLDEGDYRLKVHISEGLLRDLMKEAQRVLAP